MNLFLASGVLKFRSLDEGAEATVEANRRTDSVDGAAGAHRSSEDIAAFVQPTVHSPSSLPAANAPPHEPGMAHACVTRRHVSTRGSRGDGGPCARKSARPAQAAPIARR